MGDSFYEYLQLEIVNKQLPQSETLIDFFEELESHIEFIDKVPRDKWEKLSNIIAATYKARRDKSKRAKYSKGRNTEDPKRDKARDIGSLDDVIDFLGRFSNMYDPYEELITDDFTISRGTIKKLAKNLEVIKEQVENSKGNEYYYQDIRQYGSIETMEELWEHITQPPPKVDYTKRPKAYTTETINNKILEIITDEVATRLQIKSEIKSLSTQLKI